MSYTYRVKGGVTAFVGVGDLHDVTFDRYAERITLTGEGQFTDDSAVYTLTLYPTKELFSVYSTQNPVLATVGAVLIIFITSLAFLVYDALVRWEILAKQVVLDSKRQFMRFISHVSSSATCVSQLYDTSVIQR